MAILRLTALAGTAAMLAGCVTVPQGPNVAVMPGPGKSFSQFAAEDRVCRDYAARSVGADVNDTGTANLATGAAVGTALGAATGALIGGNRGAATGAGIGLIAGSAQGLSSAGVGQRTIQRRYDIAYEQCMYAKGNVLPSAAPATYYPYRHYSPTVVYPPPGASYPPPPPPQPPE